MTAINEVVARVLEFCNIVEDCGTGAVPFDIDGANGIAIVTADLCALLAHLATVEAERDALRADAARLDWLVARIMFDQMSDGSVRLTMDDGYTVPGMKGSCFTWAIPCHTPRNTSAPPSTQP